MNAFLAHCNSYRYVYGSVCVLVVSVVGAMSIFHDSIVPFWEAKTIGRSIDSFKELQDRFESLAEKKGALYAFEVLRRATLPPNTDLHLLGHVVGDMLYKQKGVPAIADCTQEFRNACSHTIVIGALNEFGGEPALHMISDACKKAPGGIGAYTMCYHGLGHGIFAFYEYSIPETVALCEKTGTDAYKQREATECMGGVVMELVGGGGHDRSAWTFARKKYLSDPVEFCLSDLIPIHARYQCLSYMTPELWRRVGINLHDPDFSLMKDAFALCEAIPESQVMLRHACFGGFGKEFVPLALNRDIRHMNSFGARESALTEAWCSETDNKEGRDACISQAVQSLFWGGENDPMITFRFCATLGAETRDACYRELDTVIDQYIRDSRRTALCAELPSDFQDRCTKTVELPQGTIGT